MLIARAELTEIEDITVWLYLRGLWQSIWLELGFRGFATETVAYQYALKVDEIIKKMGQTKWQRSILLLVCDFKTHSEGLGDLKPTVRLEVQLYAIVATGKDNELTRVQSEMLSKLQKVMGMLLMRKENDW